MFQSSKFTTLYFCAVSMAAAMMLTGCASGLHVQSREAVVMQRAEARGQATVKGDMAAAYALTTPSYRKLRSLNDYARSFGSGAKWESAQVKSLECDVERCKVALTVGVKPLIRGGFADTISVQFEEIWLLEDGNWWLHQGL